MTKTFVGDFNHCFIAYLKNWQYF